MLKGHNLIVHPDADLHSAISRAVALETLRGRIIAKQTANHKIDVVAALAMGALATVQTGKPGPLHMDARTATARGSHAMKDRLVTL